MTAEPWFSRPTALETDDRDAVATAGPVPVAQPATTERPALSVDETAELLGISKWLVLQSVRRGELPAVRIGRRILIPRIRLQAFLAGPVAAEPAGRIGRRSS